MPKAIFNGRVIAESESFEMVEGNVYFPPESIRRGYFKPTDHHTTCGWKGVASYYTVAVDGEEARDVAWYYPDPLPAAANIKNHVAFYSKVKVER